MSINRTRWLYLTHVCIACWMQYASADFLDDSHLSLDTRNFYMNRDFRQDSAVQSKAEDWGQGFLLNAQSGYTAGLVGFGIDMTGLLGVKLDSGSGTSGTGAIPFSPRTHHPVDEFGALLPTLKVRVSNTVAKTGALAPLLPVLFRNDTRLLPQTFYGTLIESKEITDLSLTAGRIDSTRLRDSSGRDDMTVYGVNPSIKGDRFDLVGAAYNWTPQLSTQYFHAELQNIYKQGYYNLVYSFPITSGLKVKADLRYFDSADSGSAKGGNIDNRNLNGLLTFASGSQALTLGYQYMIGKSAFPVIGGADPYTANLMTSQPFIRPQERSLQIRHDFDFAGVGIPGLSIMNRYAQGKDIDRGGQLSDDKEWERDLDIKYVIQSGPFKNLSAMWRNTSYRSRFANDIDENRLILGYTFLFY